MIELTKEQIEQIETLVLAKNKGIRVNAREVTEVYKTVTGKNVRTTSCGTCLRNRINEMEGILNLYIDQQNKKNEETLENAKKIIEEVVVEEPVENEIIEPEKEVETKVEEVVEEPEKEVEEVKTEPKKTKAPAKKKSTSTKKRTTKKKEE